MIEVLRCGALTSVQDLGRFGLRHLGIPQSGALDPLALQQANLLVGNPPGAAVLEIGVGPMTLLFQRSCNVALTGVDFCATLSPPSAPEHRVFPGQAVAVASGARLTLERPAIPGARAYLAISGGIEVPIVLGSRSTDLNAGFGGHQGRALRAGDSLASGHPSPASQRPSGGIRSLVPRPLLRALPGPDYALFSQHAQQQFWTQAWRISHQSNRMGLRLDGEPMRLGRAINLLSSGVLPGDVQVPPEGLPIVLANDAQTIGGYPRIANVIQADRWQLAQLPAQTAIYFQAVTLEVAITARQQQARYLARLAEGLAGAHDRGYQRRRSV